MSTLLKRFKTLFSYFSGASSLCIQPHYSDVVPKGASGCERVSGGYRIESFEHPTHRTERVLPSIPRNLCPLLGHTINESSDISNIEIDI